MIFDQRALLRILDRTIVRVVMIVNLCQGLFLLFWDHVDIKNWQKNTRILEQI